MSAATLGKVHAIEAEDRFRFTPSSALRDSMHTEPNDSFSKFESGKVSLARSQGASSAVDLERLDEDFGEEARNEILLAFIKYTPVLLKRLRTGIDENDEKTTRDVVHQLKGMSSSIYAEELLQFSLKMDTAVKTQPIDWRHIQSSLPDLEEVYNRARAHIATVVDTTAIDV